MKKTAIFHPSNELYVADHIMILATKALTNYKPIIYLPCKCPQCELINKELPEAEIKTYKKRPIISRSLLSFMGIIQTCMNYLKFRKYIRQEFDQHQFDNLYVNTLSCSILLPALARLKTSIITCAHKILENPKNCSFNKC